MMFTRLFTRLSLICFVLIVIAGCGKDKFDTRPSLKFKSISSYDIPYGALFEIRLEYTDAEGDLDVSDSSLIINRMVARCPSATASFRTNQLPPIPESNNSSGEIVIRYENGSTNYGPEGYANYAPSTCNTFGNVDTTFFRFYIRDKKNHVSDTIQIDRPVLIHR